MTPWKKNYLELVKPKKAHKYGAVKTQRKHPGLSFASKLEGEVYDYLLLLQKAGEITRIKIQPHVFLTKARIEMIPDFLVIENGEEIYVEAKGFQNDVYRIKRRLWKHYGPAPLRVMVKDYSRGVKLLEEIRPIT